MSVNPGNEWVLFHKCLSYIPSNIFQRSGSFSGNKRALSNDQRFAQYELKKAAARLEPEERDKEDGQSDTTAVLAEILELFNDMIIDETVKSNSVEEGRYVKLRSFIELHDGNEAEKGRFLNVAAVDLKKLKNLATQLNEFKEQRSASAPLAPAFKNQSQNYSKLADSFKMAKKLQRLSNCLFKTLVSSSSCCGSYGSHHSAKLHLLPPLHIQYGPLESALSFETFICSRSDREPQIWHEVIFDFKSEIPCLEVPWAQEKYLLCTLIEYCKWTHQGLKVTFVAKDDEGMVTITQLKHSQPKFQPALPDISLATIIDGRRLRDVAIGGEFSPSDKAALLLTLAFSLLQLSREGWLHRTLKAEDIYFLRLVDETGETANHIDQPFLSVNLMSDLLSGVSSLSPTEQSPCGALLLSFARLMLEVLMGMSIRDESHLGPVLNEAAARGHIPEALAGTIRACLNFELHINFEIGDDLEEKTRNFIFSEIVKPLDEELGRYQSPMDGRRELKLGYKARSQAMRNQSTRLPKARPKPLSSQGHSLVSTEFREASFSVGFASEVIPRCSDRDLKARTPRVMFQEPHGTESEASNSPLESNDERIAHLYQDRELPSDRRIQESGKDFFKLVNEFKNIMQPSAVRSSIKLPHWQQRPIRVAILDSGVDSEDYFIDAARDQIVEQRSFVGHSCEDNCGHGTHVIRLFLKVSSCAELYVAKISDSKHIVQDQLHVISEAIKVAIDNWDVDIISLSLGLEDDHPAMDAALDAALKPSKLGEQMRRERIVFAAAANGGAVQARAFPARKPGVICINASDGKGGSLDWLNPAPDERKENFATLGIHIPSRWKRQDVYKSGTSFATPIAAALAANILQIARVELSMSETEKDWLYSSRGMRAVLRRFSVKRDGYLVLCPWLEREGRQLKLDYLKKQIGEALKVDYFL